MPREIEDQLDEIRKLYREELKDVKRKALFKHCTTSVNLKKRHVTTVNPYDFNNFCKAENLILGRIRKVKE